MKQKQKKRRENRLHTTVLITVIIVIILGLTVLTHGATTSSGGGCCGGCSCGGCCGGCCGDEYEDDDHDGFESQEDDSDSDNPSGENVCEQRAMTQNSATGSFKQTTLATGYEYTYSLDIIACREDMTYSIVLDGLKRMTPDSGIVKKGREVARSGTVSSSEIINFEQHDVFDRMCIEVSDASIGTQCYNETG